MVANNISQCIISTDVVAKLGDQFKRYAPGYWSQPGSFINHEFFKHGSCESWCLNYNHPFLACVIESACVAAVMHCGLSMS